MDKSKSKLESKLESKPRSRPSQINKNEMMQIVSTQFQNMQISPHERNSFPSTLREFLEELDDMKRRKISNEDIMKRVNAVAYKHFIRIRHEFLPDNTIGRIILSYVAKTNMNRPPICTQMNGVVLDSKTWNVLVVPPGVMNSAAPIKEIDRLLSAGSYDVYEIMDGTIVTLYPYGKNEWAIASSRGYDVSSLKWIGNFTYAEIIHDVMRKEYKEFCQKMGVELMVEDEMTKLVIRNLDRKYSYTIGFRHHNHHPLIFDPEKLWLIHSLEIETCQIRYDQKLMDIPMQDKYEENSVTYEQLKKKCQNSFTEAVKFIAMAYRGGEKVKQKYKFNYGYMLKANCQVSGELKNVIIESPFLKHIKKILYEKVVPETAKKDITPANRMEYNMLRAFMTVTERDNALDTFPTWTPAFKSYSEYMKELIDMIYHCMRQKSMEDISKLPDYQCAKGKLAIRFMNHILKHERINFDENCKSIIRDYVIQPEYVTQILETMKRS